MGIQLVIPMAGLGSRFANAGYKEIKPLIPIHGVPMISIVISNLANRQVDHLILVCQRKTMEETNLRKVIPFDGPVTLLGVDELTDGPAGTVQVAYPAIDGDQPLVIANSDQYVDADMTSFYSKLQDGSLDGNILAMEDTDPKWSYVSLDQSGLLSEIREKKVISNLATVGIYGYSKARFAFEAFKEMRARNDRTNGEYYVGPAYNYMVERGQRVGVENLGEVATIMHGLGIPQDLERFVGTDLSRRAADKARVRK